MFRKIHFLQTRVGISVLKIKIAVCHSCFVKSTIILSGKGMVWDICYIIHPCTDIKMADDHTNLNMDSRVVIKPRNIMSTQLC